MTILEILTKTTDFFAGRGIDNARLNAELLLCRVLGLKRIDLYVNYDKPLQKSEVDAYREFVRRRGIREPLQHILGSAAFLDIEVTVNRSALIPRPDTETLLEALFQDAPDLAGKSALDLGTGTGILALSLRKRFPECRVSASDVSPEALELARNNGAKLGLEVEWVLSDCFKNLQGRVFDVIVSNPPYIRTADLAGLAPEVRDFDPRLALDGGEDGLVFYRRFFKEAAARLAPEGRIYLEVGKGQAQEVAALGSGAGFIVDRVQRDLANIERVVVMHS